MKRGESGLGIHKEWGILELLRGHIRVSVWEVDREIDGLSQ